MSDLPLVPVIATRHFTHAEDFLSALTPHARGAAGDLLWRRGDAEGWIFRGQAEALWKLLPSAFRSGAFLPFIAGQLVDVQRDPMEHARMERDFVLEFATKASRRGFELPGDTPELRSRPQAQSDEELTVDFPPLRERGVFALAQHYGIPTRLLDWTMHPFAAAYFAAIEPAGEEMRQSLEGSTDRRLRALLAGVKDLAGKGSEEAIRLLANDERLAPTRTSDGNLAVWALQSSLIDDTMSRWDFGVDLISAPGSSIPNLQAQGGLFTLVRFTHIVLTRDPSPTLDELLATENIVQLIRKEHGFRTLPLLYKFTLPHTQARRLLHFLEQLDVSVASLFPSRESVRDQMADAWIRQVTQPEK